MRSHRLALTTLSVVAVLAATGCGSGRDASSFLPDTPETPAATPGPQGASAIPQVVVAGPKQELLEERDAAKAAAAASQAEADRLEKRGRATRKELREEREKREAARKRHARRERVLRRQLAAAEAARKAAAEKAARATTAPTTPKPADPSIGASDTGSDLVAERNKRSDLEARAAVVRFHELLDRRDVRSCDLLTQKLLTDFYGAEDPMGRCRSAVESIDTDVGVTIAESRTYGKASTLAVVTRIGEQDIPQTMHLVLVDGTWELDRVERRTAD